MASPTPCSSRTTTCWPPAGSAPALDATFAYLRAEGLEGVVVQCEIDRLDQLDDAIAHGATQILLDNMSPDDMAEAVRRGRAANPGVLFEASGGLTLATVAAVAATGVDFVAVGGLTHSSPILDVALDFHAGA